ncbi:MAG: hypothetical protein UT93_C0004G0007 [Candidatus Woesebacteria bacterium GW2011_GWF1_40_24]|uniref:DUF5659 domain-containing protein n=1 Tax=Candidatus Woesebacteria bacterium GW2011_GWF1_40_24 TaxID=1618601 RepID=A0A0G0RU01_9BACT|nr:MAG: hypothetical protein UT93_C0004G0007 [Candidatus Woesebacteria bacterium GW2011_GWF1_40_24]
MQKQFKTKDFYEASACIASKQKLACLEKDGNFYWFVFEDCDGCLKISDLFWRNELKVLAKDYADAIRSLKDRLFARA